MTNHPLQASGDSTVAYQSKCPFANLIDPLVATVTRHQQWSPITSSPLLQNACYDIIQKCSPSVWGEITHPMKSDSSNRLIVQIFSYSCALYTPLPVSALTHTDTRLFFCAFHNLPSYDESSIIRGKIIEHVKQYSNLLNMVLLIIW